jgi:hypothetical protein
MPRETLAAPAAAVNQTIALSVTINAAQGPNAMATAHAVASEQETVNRSMVRDARNVRR